MSIDFPDGWLALHAIFVRGGGRLKDAELLLPLGLAGYRRRASVVRGDRYVALASIGDWTMIEDDLYYTLSNRRSTADAIAWFARDHDVFTYDVRDADPSFGLAYYRGGQTIRRYRVDLGTRRTPRFLAEEGEPLRGESALILGSDNLPALRDIAASLGITMPSAAHERRFWVSPTDEE